MARGPRKVSVLAAAGVRVDVGTLPHADWMVTVAGGVRYQRMEVTIVGAIGPQQDTTLNGQAGARLTAANAALNPCYAAFLTGRLRLGACAAIEVGWFRAEGVGTTETRAATTASLSIGGGPALWFALLERLEARLDIAALVPVVRPNFEVAGLGSVFEPGVAIRGACAAVVRF